VIVPSIVLVEAVFLLQRQRMKEDVLAKLFELPEKSDANFYVTPLDLAVVHALRSFGPAAVPELSDRIIAATALALGLPLLTTDSAIVNSGLVETVD
jgi:predicted nucleic acid-binding protein